MTEQELRTSITPCIMAGNTWFVFDEIKAYADARVAQECKVLDEVVTLLHQTIANRNVTITELKASLNTAQQMYTDLLVGTTDAIDTKDAEIKRLREGITREINVQAELLEKGINTGQVFDSVLKVRRCVVDALESLLSPAPVTETLNEDQHE